MNYKPEELLKAIVSCSPDGYVASDEFGKITFVNEAIERITGWSFKELIGLEVGKIYSLPESLTKLSGDENYVKPQAAILFQRDGNKITFKARQIEMRSIGKNNSNGEFKGYLTIFHTESHITSSLDRAQVDFVSTVSHELR